MVEEEITEVGAEATEALEVVLQMEEVHQEGGKNNKQKGLSHNA